MIFLFDIGFLEFRLLDLIDILLVAFALFIIYKLVRGSIALNISIGIAAIFIIWWLVRALQMQLVSGILGQFIEVGVIAVLIVFQQEIRRVLLLIGRNAMRAQEGRNWKMLMPWTWQFKEEYDVPIDEIVNATRKLSSTKTGAIIVINKESDLKAFTSTGVSLRSEVKTDLLISIFQKTSPLHDGAVIIANKMIIAASCILPVSQSRSLPRNYGTRHRAAIGLSEQTDAIVVVVSEENGNMSFVKNGKLFTVVTPEEMNTALVNEFQLKTNS